jgi:hypothetical protein
MRALIFGSVVLLVACGSANDGGIFSPSASGFDAGPGGARAVVASGGAPSGGSPGATGAASSSGGASACLGQSCLQNGIFDCCPDYGCVPGTNVCSPWCRTDADCPSGWGCVNGSHACPSDSGFPPDWACQNHQETICASPCVTDADCPSGACVTFDGTKLLITIADTCRPAPRRFCGDANQTDGLRCR